MRVLASWAPRNAPLRVSLLAEIRDLWVGMYWNITRPPCLECTKHWTLDLYLCLIPCFPLRITWGHPR